MATASITSGDTVKLKSGGPLMTVSHQAAIPTGNEQLWICCWFVGRGVQQHIFSSDALEAATREARVRRG